MTKKRTKTAWRNKLDKLCRTAVRLIFDNRCARCKKYIEGANSHPHHIIAKGNAKVSKRRFDLLNIILLCFRCHRSWHDNPVDGMEWFNNSEYKSRLEYLERYRYGVPSPISEDELEAKEAELIQKIKEFSGS